MYQESLTSLCGTENQFWEWVIDAKQNDFSFDFLTHTHTYGLVIMTPAPCKIITGNRAGRCAGSLSTKLLCVEVKCWQIWSKSENWNTCVCAFESVGLIIWVWTFVEINLGGADFLSFSSLLSHKKDLRHDLVTLNLGPESLKAWNLKKFKVLTL